MALEALSDLTGMTLQRLRQIRRVVVDTNPQGFDGQLRRDAEGLIDGLVSYAVVGLLEKSESLIDLEQQQRLMLDETSVRYGEQWPYTSSGSNDGQGLVWQMCSLAKDTKRGENPWRKFLERSYCDCIAAPDESDVVVAPLSTGAIGARMAHVLAGEGPKLALAVTRFDRTGWREERRKTGEAYLPEGSSWPRGELKLAQSGRFRLVDDMVVLATTLKEIERKLIESGVDPKLIVR